MSSLSCMALCIMINFFVLWYICLSFLLIHLRMVESILQGELPCFFITLKRFLLQNMVSRSFLVVLGNSVVFGFLFCFAFFFLSDGPIPIFPSACNFFLSKLSDAFLICHFYSFYCFFSSFALSTWHIFNPKFHSYILAVYSYCMRQRLHFFFIFD